MRDEAELRRMLRDVVPEPPPGAARVSAARRAGRRRRSAIAVIAAAVLVGSAGLTWSFLDRTGELADAVDEPDLPLACPQPDRVLAGSGAPGRARPKPLAPVVTRARLCNHDPRSDVQVPTDLLVSGATQIASEIDGLDVSPSSESLCRGPGLTTFNLVFGTPDRSEQRTVWLDTQSCGAVVVDGFRLGTAKDATRLRILFQKLLGQQRALSGTPDQVVEVGLRCAARFENVYLSVLTNLESADLVRAVYCRVSTRSPRDVDSATIAPEDVRTLLASLHSDLEPAVFARCPLPRSRQYILGHNAWGDRFVINQGCLGAWYGPGITEGSNPLQWSPRGDAQDVIDRLAAEVGKPRA